MNEISEKHTGLQMILDDLRTVTKDGKAVHAFDTDLDNDSIGMKMKCF